MVFGRKKDERKDIPVVERKQTDEQALTAAVGQPKMQAGVLVGQSAAPEEPAEPELDDDAWYKFSLELTVTGRMLKKMRDYGEKMGYVDEADVIRAALRKLFWGV